MPVKLPPNYKISKIIQPEITSCFGIMFYWLALFASATVFFSIPLFLTEYQLSDTATYSQSNSTSTSYDDWAIFIGILCSVFCVWLLDNQIHKLVMKFFGAKSFTMSRSLSDIRILGKKKYIPRVLLRNWVPDYYFKRNQYLLVLVLPHFIIAPLLLGATLLIHRSK